MDADFTEVCDRLQDTTRELAKLTKAVMAREAPVVNVSAPSVRPPDVVVNQAGPSINVERPAMDYEVRDIKRDKLGYLTGFTISCK